jgi:hypothetical protein
MAFTGFHVDTTTQTKPLEKALTWRAFIIGILATVINVYWTTVVEVRWYTLDTTSLPLFITPIFILFCIVVLNAAFGRLAKRALSSSELICIYVMLVVSSSLSGHDMLQNLFGAIAHAVWYESPSNRWADLFLNEYPKWLTITDKEVLRGFYLGDDSPYKLSVLLTWAKALSWWTLLIAFLLCVMFGFNALLRRQWTEHERLAFPIIQLPIAMVHPTIARTFWFNRMMWLGFSIAAFIDIVNGLHELYPSFPYFTYIKLYNWHDLITNRPWSAIRPLRTSMYPFAIGLCYLLPLDLSLSCWVFFLVRFAEQLFGAVFGWDQVKGYPFFNQQAAGSWIAIGLCVLLSLRHSLKTALKKAIRREDDPEECMPYSLALSLVLIGVAGIYWFSFRMGMGWLSTTTFYAIYFTYALAITRVRAELGAPHEIYFAQPRFVIADMFGTSRFSVRELTAINMLHWFNRGYRCHPMPNQMEALKMAQIMGIPQRTMMKHLAISFPIALLITYWANLHVCYREGAVTRCIGFKNWVGWESFNVLSSWLISPQQRQWRNIYWMIGGFVIVLVLRWMRLSFSGFQLHHAGYALAISFAMDYFWFAFLISWMAKYFILRFGGIQAHRKAIPFFLGLILGDYTLGSFWAIYGPIKGVRTYRIYI